jgi:GTP-binding protein
VRQAYHHASFMLGVAKLSQLPTDTGHEVAIAGRSNAGKSSALNVITGIRSLARISKTPGRTQQINFFSLDQQRRLVDLPGYGYARVPQGVKLAWQQLVEKYLETRHSLRGIVIVMDIRHPLMNFDNHLLHWCYLAGMPVHILLTKSDKLSRGAAAAALHKVRLTVEKDFVQALPTGRKQENEPTVQLFSALKKTGVDEIHVKLDEWLDFG